MEKVVAVHVSIVDAATIDRVNIYQATMNGMYEAILSLEPKPDKVLILSTCLIGYNKNRFLVMGTLLP